MPSSYTSRNRFTKQATGENTNTWGEIWNSGVGDLADFALDGWAPVTVDGPVTLTSVNGATDQARARVLKLSGTGGTVTLPAIEKWYIAWNAGSGDMTLTVGGVTTAVIEPDDKLVVLTDGAGVYSLALGGLALKAYIDSATLAATGSLPATTGNEGKSLFVRSGAWTPDRIGTADIGDYLADQTNRQAAATARAIAFAVAL